MKCKLLNNTKNKNGEIFAVASVILFLIWLVLLISGNDLQKDVFFLHGEDFFADYYNVAKYSCTLNPYCYGEVDAKVTEHNYLPIVYCMFYILSKFAPYTSMSASDAMRTNSGIFTSQVMMFVWIIALLLVLEYLMRNYKYKKIVIIALLMTGSMMFSYERGNVLMIAVAFSAFFVAFYKSENTVIKELAILSLALAACFKLYPAVLGMLLLRNKDWKGAVRAALYALALAIIPFAFIKGGFKCIPILLKNVAYSNASYTVKIYPRFGFRFFLRWNINNYKVFILIGKTIDCIIALCMIVTVCFRKSEWLAVLGLTTIIILFPANSAYYTSLYLMIPVAMMSGEKATHKSYIYLALLIITMMPLKIVSADFSNMLEVIAVYLIAVLCVIGSCIDVKEGLRSLRHNNIASKNSKKIVIDD